MSEHSGTACRGCGQALFDFCFASVNPSVVPRRLRSVDVSRDKKPAARGKFAAQTMASLAFSFDT
jgi:hypothetical protein